MKKLILILFLSISGSAFGQNVGIGTATPAERLHVNGNLRVDPLAGVGTRVVGADANGTLQVIAPGTTGQVLTQTATGPQWANAMNITSVSLAADYTLTAAAWANVTGMSITFTATKSTAFLMFSSSGFAYTNSMAFVQFRIRDVGAGTTLGGTNSITQNYDDVTGTVTPWSCTFTRYITGLTVGASYTYRVQGQRGGIFGTYDTAIWPASNPDSHHMTLSVIQ